MDSDFASVLSSDIAQILAQGHSRFFVHKNILASQSKPFRDALTGEWKEAAEGKIDLNDWDGVTVVRMLQFLYRGNYRYPDPEKIPNNATPATELRSEALTTSAPEVDVLQRLKRFDPALYDYGEVLICHAKVYQLAHYKAIDTLREVALQHLEKTLWRLDPVDPATGLHNIARVAELARDVYENTDDLENHVEPLRSLVCHFIARNYSAMQSKPEMIRLLSKGGGIVMDVMEILAMGPSKPWVPVQSATRYISKLLVWTGKETGAPHHHLREIYGGHGDLNSDCSDKSAWLYTAYSLNPLEALTGFTVETEYSSHTDMCVNFATNRRIVQQRNEGVKRKITALVLLRQEDPLEHVSDIPIHLGKFDDMTNDLNWGRQGNYLYLVWKSVLVA